MARPRAYKLKGSYGEFNGSKVYFLGFDRQPGFLPASGRGFAGLKHMLEQLKAKLKKFSLTFTPTEDSIKEDGKGFKVRLAVKTVRKFGQKRWNESRELNLRLAQQSLAEVFPERFHATAPVRTYQRGMFAEILSPSLDTRMVAPEDRAAITKFVTEAVGSQTAVLDIPTAYKTTRDVQLLYLERLVQQFDREVAAGHDEAWWQKYFSQSILFFQDNYIRKIEKLNVIVAGTQFPDFLVITSDGYLDILEIKKPDTGLLREDSSRHNFYWAPEIAKAISQVENYIDRVTKHSDAIRTRLRDDHNIDLRIIKPRGIIIAGQAAEFGGKPKRADDFRLLNEGLKNVEIVPYDELSQRLKNTIVSIQQLAGVQKQSRKGRQKKRSL
jgi:antiviral defense system Shedu protein SduA